MKLHELDESAAASPEGGIFGLPFPVDECHVVLIPVPWDVTTSYRPGTSKGPAAIVRASHQIDLYDTETGRPYRVGIAMLEEDPEIVADNARGRALAAPIIAAGGAEDSPELDQVNRLCGELNQWVRARADEWLDQGRLVGVVGGDHASPFGLIEAIAQRHPGVGILHVDAHADLRAAFEGFTWSHASIMHNVMARLEGVARLVQVGVRDLCDEEMTRARRSGGRIITHHDTTLGRAAPQRRDLGGAVRGDRPGPAGRGLPLHRHRRARPLALPAHRHPRARRPLLCPALRCSSKPSPGAAGGSWASI